MPAEGSPFDLQTSLLVQAFASCTLHTTPVAEVMFFIIDWPDTQAWRGGRHPVCPPTH